ncbi:MAG: ArsB/NhaD family transporter [Pseudomonadota bacterium]
MKIWKQDGLMLKRMLIAAVPLLFVLYGSGAWCGEPAAGKSVIVVHGKVQDSRGNPLDEARVTPYYNKRPFAVHGTDKETEKSLETGAKGLFMLEIPSDDAVVQAGKWGIKVGKAGFGSSGFIPLKGVTDQGVDAKGVHRWTSTVEVTMDRVRGTTFWIALVVFLAVYVLIAFEVVHRTLAALLGATVILVITHTAGTFNDAFKVLTYDQALHAVDWNVVFLLMGMMIIVGVLKMCGLFQWLAYKSFEAARGKIFILSSALCIVTAVASAFLDNVTTMLLITPVTMEIAAVLGVSPFIFLLPEIVASNFGGTATLIGDPPNIMIGSYAGLTFNDFVINLTPVVVAVTAVQILYNRVLYGRKYGAAVVEDVPGMISFLKDKYQITDYRILKVGGTVLLGVILLFVLHGFFHMEVSVAALFGAGMIVLLNRADIVKILEHEIEWPALVFFIMLFIVVGAAEQTGILQAIADWIMSVCKGDLVIAVLLILWVSGIASAIVDNIPFTATMLPIVAYLTKTLPGAESGVLWWALALGACFGGNGTIIGASANVVTTGLAERAGHKITFYDYMKEAAPITLISLLISTVFLLIRY